LLTLLVQDEGVAIKVARDSVCYGAGVTIDREVEVGRELSQEQVAHAAAHEVDGDAGGALQP
jgi:hypothetical protein